MVKKLVLYPELLGLKPEEEEKKKGVDNAANGENLVLDQDGGDASAQAKKPAISAGTR
jgi:hypothetical protein